MRLVYRVKQLMLAGGDMLCFALGFWLSLLIRNWQIPEWNSISLGLGPFFVLFLFWLVIIFINGLYDLHLLKQENRYRRFLEAAALSLVFGIFYFYIAPVSSLSPKTLLVLNALFGFGLGYGWRLIFNKYINTSKLQTKIIFVGLTPETAELIKILEDTPERGYKVAALFDPTKEVKQTDYPFFDVLQDLADLKEAAEYYHAEIIIIAPQFKKDELATKKIYKLFFSNVKIVDLTSFYEVITGRIPPSTFSEAWFLENLKKDQIIYEKIRIFFDLFIGSLMLLVFIVLLPFVALATKLSSPGPLFFKQKRVGQFEKIFYIYKFRSMFALAADGSAEIAGARFAAKNDARITSIGKFLRKTRLDELPQCLNLLKREITLIGPRPERPEITNQLTSQMPYYSLRHIVKPGLTGWAVIHQNYTDNLESSLKKLQYDLYYIKNRSFLLDLVILLRTVNVVMRMMGQ